MKELVTVNFIKKGVELLDNNNHFLHGFFNFFSPSSYIFYTFKQFGNMENFFYIFKNLGNFLNFIIITKWGFKGIGNGVLGRNWDNVSINIARRARGIHSWDSRAFRESTACGVSFFFLSIIKLLKNIN